MTRMNFVACAMVAMAVVGCRAPAKGAPNTAGAHGDEVVATIGDHAIYMRDVERKWKAEDPKSFGRLQQQVLEIESRLTTELVGEYLLEVEAKKQGVTSTQLLEAKLASHVESPPTEADIQRFYEQSSVSKQGLTLEAARPTIVSYLQRYKSVEGRREYLASITEKAGQAVSIRLRVPKANIKTHDNDPVKGVQTAAIEIIEYSDFQCPYCLQMRSTLSQLSEKYGDRVKIVWKHFPLPIHQMAKPAAEAAQCANDQGKFWEYHDQLFEHQEALAGNNLRRYASAVGLNIEEFDKCVETGKYKSKIAADLAEGAQLGISATPTVFINGRMITGNAPLPVFEQMIREELTVSRMRASH